MNSWMLAAILLCGTACVTGNTNADKEAKGTTAVAESANSFDVIMDAINQYLVDSIGSQYTAGDMCIPVIMMTCSDGMKGDSVFMWGDYWVFNYKVAGDTLKCVSGGDHPGKMLLKKKENVNAYVDRAVDVALMSALKNAVHLDEKEVTLDEFRALN